MYQREYNKKVRVGIVGAGSHTYRNLLPALHFLPAELVAICNRSEERLNRTIAEYHCNGYTCPEEMYEKEQLDGVIMAVSPFLHPKLACESLAHNLHVFIEKPAAASMDGIREMISASEKYKKHVVVGYKKAFMPATCKVTEILESGLYPDMSSILAIYPIYMPKDGPASLKSGEFSEWLKNCSHPLSFMLQAAGPVKSVQALINERGFGVVQLRFQNGVIGNLHLAAGEKPARDEYKIYGKGWSIEVDCSSRVTLHRGIPSYEYDYASSFASPGFEGGDLVWEPVTCQASPENKALFVQGMVQELEYFCNCILTDQSPQKGSLAFAGEITEIFQAALLSNGKEICIP